MSQHETSGDRELESLDRREMRDTTESGELERPRLRRTIDCAGTPEIADRGQAPRRGAPKRNAR